MKNSTLDPAQLLHDLRWVRGMAAGLVRDANTADDLAQETWVRALEHAPRDDEGESAPPRAWLATVLRNLARERGRRGARRTRREQAAARQEALPSAEELAGRVELQRRIAQEVLALAEPLRTTLLLRYVHGLEPSEIARREHTPPGTVRSRLKRGLDELRARLDRSHGGDRRAWMGLVSPWAGEGVGAVYPHCLPAGGAAASGAGWLAAAAVVIAVVAVTRWVGGSDDAVPLAGSVASEGSSHPGASGSKAGVGAATLRAALPVLDGEDSAALEEVLVRGRVVDTQGTPLAGITVRVGAAEDPFPSDCELPRTRFDHSTGRRLVTTADGTFRAQLARAGPIEVSVERPARYQHSHKHSEAVLRHSVEAPADGVDFVLVENSAAELTVRVFDAATDRYLDTFRVSFRGEGIVLVERVEDGRFHRELALATNAPETFVLGLVEPRSNPPLQRDVVLRPDETTEVVFAIQSDHVLRGRVTDERGVPLEGALVFFGSIEEALGDEPRESFRPNGIVGARTDADGRYELAGSGATVGVWHARHASATALVEDAYHVTLAPRGSVLLRGAANGAVGVDDDEAVGEVRAGELRLDDLDPRTHWIQLSDGTKLGVGVRSGETTRVDLAARIAGVRLDVRAGGEHPLSSAGLEGILVGAGEAFTVHELEGPPPFELAGVLPGAYHAFFGDGRQGRVEIASATATLDLGDAPLQILAPPRARIAVGPARAQGWLVLLPQRLPLRVDAEGVASLPQFPAGSWTATNLGSGKAIDFEVGTEPVVVDLR